MQRLVSHKSLWKISHFPMLRMLEKPKYNLDIFSTFHTLLNFPLHYPFYIYLGLFQKKYLEGGGEKANNIFMDGWCGHFFKLYGSLVFEKSHYMGGGVYQKIGC